MLAHGGTTPAIPAAFRRTMLLRLPENGQTTPVSTGVVQPQGAQAQTSSRRYLLQEAFT